MIAATRGVRVLQLLCLSAAFLLSFAVINPALPEGSIPNRVKGWLDDIDRLSGMAPKQRGPHWAIYSSPSLPGVDIVLETSDTTSNRADRVVVVRDKTILYALNAEPGSSNYTACHLRQVRGVIGTVTLWSSRKNGMIDGLTVESVDGSRQVAVANRSNTRLVAVWTMDKVSGLWVSSPSPDDPDLTVTLLYEPASRHYSVAAFYSSASHKLLDVFARRSENQWLEYVFSDSLNRVVAVGVHDVASRRLQKVLVDVGDESQDNILLSLDSANQWQTRSVGIDPDHLSNPTTWDSLSTTMEKIDEQYRQVVSTVNAAGGFGWRLPRVLNLPDNSVNRRGQR